MSVNTVVVSGRLGDEPKFYQNKNNNGTSVNFSIAVSDNYKDQRGEWQERTHWIRVSAFAPYVVEKIKNVHKGYLVFIQGKLTSSNYVDNQTNKSHQTMDVQIESLSILDFGKSNDIRNAQMQSQNQYQQMAPQQQQQFNQNNYQQQNQPQRSYQPQNSYDPNMPF